MPSLSSILQKMNGTIPLKNTRDLIQRAGVKITEQRQRIGQKAAQSLQVYSVYNERLRTLLVRLEGSIDRNGAKELMKRLKGALDAEIQRIILDFKDVGAFSLEAMALLSRQGFLQTGEEGLLVAINAPEQNR
jgi:anti-anti-sigma regulatory factor